MSWIHNGRKYWYHKGKKYSCKFKKRYKSNVNQKFRLGYFLYQGYEPIEVNYENWLKGINNDKRGYKKYVSINENSNNIKPKTNNKNSSQAWSYAEKRKHLGMKD